MTKAGAVLKQHALKIMDDLKSAENDLRPWHNQQRDSIAIGVSGSHLILPVFQSFIGHYPDISLTVKEHSSEQTIKKITDGSLDMGIVYQMPLPSHLSATLLFEDEIIAAIPLSHPLADQRVLQLEDLNDQPLIVLNDALLLRTVITNELNRKGVVANIICELDNHYSCLEYAEGQIGIALIACSLADGPDTAQTCQARLFHCSRVFSWRHACTWERLTSGRSRALPARANKSLS